MNNSTKRLKKRREPKFIPKLSRVFLIIVLQSFCLGVARIPFSCKMHRVGEKDQRSISRGRGLPRAHGSFPSVPGFGIQRPTFVSFPDHTPFGCGDNANTEFDDRCGDHPDPPRPQHVVSVSLPHFYERNCQLWILMVENIFRQKGISSEQQKFELSLSALDLRQVEKLQRIFRSLSDSQPYTQLKREIIRVFAPTNEANLDRLLYEVQLGDKDPSDLLFEMQELLGDQQCPALLEKLFKERLPDSVRKILAAAPPCSIEELAFRADAILKEERSCRSRNSTIDNTSNNSAALSESAIGSLLSNLTTAVNKLSERDSRNITCSYIPSSSGNVQNSGRDQRRVPYTSTPRFPRTGGRPPLNDIRTTSHDISNPDLCYYHSRFGEQAFKCCPPCSWKPKPENSNEPGRQISFSGTIRGGPDELMPGLIFVKDPETHIRFLIDTGSEFSLLPCARPFDHPSRTKWLHAANDTKVPVFEPVTLTVSLNLERPFTWTFLRADVRYATIGLDFLRHFGLSVNVVTKTLIENHTLSFRAPTHSATIPDVSSEQPSALDLDPTPAASMQELFDRYTFVFELTNFLKPIRHSTKLHIETTGSPVCGRTRRLSPERMEVLDRELRKLLDLGIIVPASSPWGSPVHLVPKSNPGEFRITGDYRLLNKQTTPDRYPIPFLTDFTDNMSGCCIFSSLDLYKSYHQIEVAENDVKKTAILTPLGSFAFKRASMGLKNSGAAMQRLMDEVTRGLDFAYVYIDDILVFSKSKEEHLVHLTKLFERLQHFGLVLNKDKCVFMVDEIAFLGYTVGKDGIRPKDSRVEAIRNFSRPRTHKELKRYLGMLNFYRRHVPNAAEVLAPLNKLTSTKKGRKPAFIWNDKAESAFIKSKELLADSTLLEYPVKGAPTALTVDASGVAVGGALHQEVDGVMRPLAFFSKALSPAETKYSTFDRELLATYLSVKHFRYFLEGRSFHIYSDQRPLVNAFAGMFTNGTARQTRHMSYIAQFTTDIRHVKGTENVVADCLSRPNVNALFNDAATIDFEALSQAQQTDPWVEQVKDAENTSLELKTVDIPGSQSSLLVDVSQGGCRPLVPMSFRKQVFDALHFLSHPGVKGSQRLVSERFVWAGMKKDIKRFVNCCQACQKSKVQRHVKAPLHQFELPSERFAHVHVDLVGKLPESHGYTYLLTIVCRYTRHMECIPLSDITAKSCADAFLLHWVSRFGAPQIITTDRGRQFTSNLWAELCEFLGAKHSPTTSFRPEANGMVERMHRTLKVALRCHDNSRDWYENLGLVLLGMRAMVKEDIGMSSAELTLGTPLRIPGEFFVSERESVPQTEYGKQLIRFMSTLRPTPPRAPSRREYYVDEKLSTCSHVYVRNESAKTSLDRAYIGPYRVLGREEKYFTVELGVDHVDNVSVNRLKPCSLLLDLPEYEPGEPAHHLLVVPESVIVSAPKSPILEAGLLSPEIDELPMPDRINRFGRPIRRPVRYRRSLSR